MAKKKKLINMAVEQILSNLAEIGSCLWQKGWAERNAGNISVNITELLSEEQKQLIGQSLLPILNLDRSCPGISGFFFLVTGTGKRMRDLASEPEKNAIMIMVNQAGNGYKIIPLYNTEYTVHPTSELPAHLAIHEQLTLRGASEKAILHTHPNELISLTQIRDFCDEAALNKLLWGMHPETMVFIPDGAGFLPYMLHGSQEIADATIQKFEKHKAVIWEKHGCFAIGRDVFEAFDVIDTLSKSAQIYFQCRSAGHEPSGLTQEQLSSLKDLSKKFLE